MEGINILGISGVAFIVVMCLLIGLFAKNLPIDNKWIPVICGTFGGALGALAFACGIALPVDDYFNAVACGIVSGLGSVGCHQLVKQLTSANVIDKNENDDEDPAVRRTVAENVEEVKREQAEQYERELEE